MIKQDTIAATMSQTPFGCWSDQDRRIPGHTNNQTKERHKRLSAVGPIRTRLIPS